MLRCVSGFLGGGRGECEKAGGVLFLDVGSGLPGYYLSLWGFEVVRAVHISNI